jgi:phage major tail protein 2
MNGSNVLFTVGGKGLGHSTTHSVTYNTETKERGVKPPVKEKTKNALFSGKGVTKMSISVHGEGFRYKGEEELSLDDIRKLWGIGQSVELSCFEREGDDTPYLKGKFVISKVEETSPAQDDATFTVDFENDGEPEVYPGQTAATDPGHGG